MEQPGQSKIIILDDVVESFDYKNKYSILYYLNDFIYNIEEYGNNKLIILSHNFDFIRTCQHYFTNAKTLFAKKNKVTGILSFKDFFLDNTNYKNLKNKDDALKVFSNWRDKLETKDDSLTQKCILITFIPIIRNINNLLNKKENNLLNKILHYCPTEIMDNNESSSKIKWKELSDEYKKVNIEINNFNLISNNSIHEDIFSCANQIYENFKQNEKPPIEIYDELRDKMVLSIAIRLILEKTICLILKENGYNFEPDNLSKINLSFLQQEIRKNKLSNNDEYKKLKHFIASAKSLSNDIVHINSFMYEPIIDLDYDEVINLYVKVKNEVNEHKKRILE